MPLELSPTTVLPTHENEVGLVVDVPPAAMPHAVRLLARHHVSASFATAHAPNRTIAHLLARHDDQTISVLSRPGIDDWLGTMDAVRDVRGSRFVLTPGGGMSAGQYVLASLADARLIAPAKALKPGAVVIWKGGSLGRVLATIRAHGLRAVSVTSLDTAKPPERSTESVLPARPR
jgi:hypothetical protein